MLNLGNLYVSDFPKMEESSYCKKKYPLELEMNKDIGAPRLTVMPPSSEMWGKYWYRSGTNATMKKDLKSLVDEICDRIDLQEGDLWCDIAANDGTLLSFVPDGVYRLGVDPADDSYYEESSKIADQVIQDYFSYEAYLKSKFAELKPKVITTIAMFYDLQDPDSFIQDVYKVLDDNGVWVVQISYTPLMLAQMAFDNICHEHYYYHSLSSLKILFERNGLEIVDASLNDVNGGSIRVYAQKKNRTLETFGTSPLRDVCSFRVESLLEIEKNKYDISKEEIWEEFAQKIESLKSEVVGFIKSQKAKGKTVAALGASTKGNTLLQVFGLDSSLIDCIAERSPYKFGLKTIGTEIPILSEEEVRAKNPDYLLILPWHFIKEFKEREKDYLKNGGKFIVPCPKFEIVEYEE